jgi:hypothetical protein
MGENSPNLVTLVRRNFLKALGEKSEVKWSAHFKTNSKVFLRLVKALLKVKFDSVELVNGIIEWTFTKKFD